MSGRKLYRKSPVDRVHARNDDGLPICGSTLRDGKRICHAVVLAANGRCRLHGGSNNSSPFGTKDFLAVRDLDPLDRSKSLAAILPPELREAFESSMNDPDQLSLKVELGLMDANLVRIMKIIENRPSPDEWIVVQKLVHEIKRAAGPRTSQVFSTAIKNLEDACDAGIHESETWRELQSTLLARARVAEAETKRRVASKALLSVQEAELIAVTVFRILTHHVKDRDVLQAIRDDYVRAMALPNMDFEPTVDVSREESIGVLEIGEENDDLDANY